MPGNPIAGHPPWRQLLIVCIAVPIAITLAALAFAWPAARSAPRDLPVGVVGTGAASQQAVQGLTQSRPGAFDLHLYADDAAARTAIRQRDVYGAFEVNRTGVTVLTASGAGPTVAQLLSTTGHQLAGRSAAERSIPVSTVDVVATASTDPKGTVLTSTVLPLVLGGEILAVAIAVLVGFAPAWRRLVALVLGSAVAGLGAYLIVQGYLGALPGEHLATWVALSLTLFAITCTTAGLYGLLGLGGIAAGAGLMIFVGNPFSAVSSAPELLPHPVGRLGQWLPPGAGANLLRSTAYFGGNDAGGHVLVLVVWSVFGVAAVIQGHRRAGRHSTGLTVAPLPQSAEASA